MDMTSVSDNNTKKRIDESHGPLVSTSQLVSGSDDEDDEEVEREEEAERRSRGETELQSRPSGRTDCGIRQKNEPNSDLRTSSHSDGDESVKRKQASIV